MRLHSFEQTGDGILPYSYWLDDQHRLLAAVGGVRTFIWDPTVKLPEDGPYVMLNSIQHPRQERHAELDSASRARVSC